MHVLEGNAVNMSLSHVYHNKDYSSAVVTHHCTVIVRFLVPVHLNIAQCQAAASTQTN